MTRPYLVDEKRAIYRFQEIFYLPAFLPYLYHFSCPDPDRVFLFRFLSLHMLENERTASSFFFGSGSGPGAGKQIDQHPHLKFQGCEVDPEVDELLGQASKFNPLPCPHAWGSC